MQVHAKLSGLLGDTEQGQPANLQDLTREKLAQWRRKWLLPKLTGNHILQQDWDIPDVLITEEMQRNGERDESGSDDDGDNPDSDIGSD
jgi:hypothetical protein